MGFETKALEELEELLGPGWYAKLSTEPVLKPVPGGKRKRVVIMDCPALLFLRTSKVLLGYAQTNRDLVQQLRSRVEAYLMQPDIVGVIVLFDCKAVPVKSISRHGTGGSTAETPFHDPSMAATATLEQSMAAWAEYLSRSMQPTDDARSTNLAEPVPHSPLDWELGPDDKVIKERQAADPSYAVKSHKQRLENKGFKYLEYTVCGENLLSSGLEVPEGKWVLVRAPNYTALREGDVFTAAKPELCVPFDEADAVVGYYAGLLRDFDIDVDSIDGDVIMVLLMGSWRRLKAQPNPNVPFSTESFYNRVRVLRSQWHSFANSSVLINEMFLGLQTVFGVLRNHGIQWENPVISAAALMMLCGGNDYVDSAMLPDLGTATLFRAFFQECRAFGDQFIKSHLDPVHGMQAIVVNPVAFARFVICAYRVRYGDSNLPVEQPERAFAMLRQQNRKKLESNPPTLDSINVLCANLTWTLNKFAAPSYNRETPDPFLQHAGRSVFGYVLPTLETDSHGHAKAQRATTVDSQHLLACYHSSAFAETIVLPSLKAQPYFNDTSQMIA